MTKGDQIRNMTDEELAEQFLKFAYETILLFCKCLNINTKIGAMWVEKSFRTEKRMAIIINKFKQEIKDEEEYQNDKS